MKQKKKRASPTEEAKRGSARSNRFKNCNCYSLRFVSLRFFLKIGAKLLFLLFVSFGRKTNYSLRAPLPSGHSSRSARRSRASLLLWETASFRFASLCFCFATYSSIYVRLRYCYANSWECTSILIL